MRCFAADDYLRYGKMAIDNLPPKAQKTIEDDVLLVLDGWTLRHQLTALLQLMRMFPRLSQWDIPDAQNKALKAEKARD